jgi:CRISPR/Cas system-associated exonuclease Cas4 (RecB family)
VSNYYNVPRSKYIFDPENPDGFAVSRSKINLFVECPRCFYVDQRLGVKRVPGYPFSLNSAVDQLLKNEFDQYRKEAKTHPLMEEHGIDAVPYQHRKLDDWRHHFTGVRTKHERTGFIIYGAVDDIWVNEDDVLAVVDYKATSKKDEVSLDADWQDDWKRQMEIYQWLLRANGFAVSDRSYFVYANADKERDEFADQLSFETTILSYDGDSGWIAGTLDEIKQMLMSDTVPESGADCDYCQYRKAAHEVIAKQMESASNENESSKEEDGEDHNKQQSLL